MRVLQSTAKALAPAGAVVILGICRDEASPKHLPALWKTTLERAWQAGDFMGKPGEIQLTYPATGKERVLLVGLGEKKNLTLQKIREAVGRGVHRCKQLKAAQAAVWLESFLLPGQPLDLLGQEIALAAHLAAYRFTVYKKNPAEKDREAPCEISLLFKADDKLKRGALLGSRLAEGINFARTLANQPPNAMTPADLAAATRALAKRFELLQTKVFDHKQLKIGKFGGILAVGSGSAHPPVFIEMTYRHPRAKGRPIVLVGKGITFDSGGISIKPAAKMDEMKYDMSGAAAVLGTLYAAAAMGLPVFLKGLVPAAENLPSGSAYRPGDILTSYSGKTIEVLNTDAEGRLILADALHYAKQFQPQAIVDLATLTGAAIVALGNAASAILGNQQGLIEELKSAAEHSGEKIWQLPLLPEYSEMIQSEIADMSNLSHKMGAGTSVAAAFLNHFVDAKTPWAHLDIAGTAWSETNALYAKGATGVGIRLLIHWLQQRVAK
jgi:leucyl aminopeptidase